MVHENEPGHMPPQSPYPFGFSKRDYERALERIPTSDLIAEVEDARWLALEVADDTKPGGNYEVALIQFESLVDVLHRRRKLWEARAGSAIRPAWPPQDGNLRPRVEAIKAAWPIDRFCSELLGMDLHHSGRDRLKGRCPLPGHDDRTPSFTVYLATDSAWCHGCNRGGDQISLTGFMFGLERFYERLEHLERLTAAGARVGQ